jgi:hypothetical protein
VNSFLCRIQFDHIRPYQDRVLEVQLEDLAANPRAVMQTVLRFVGEPWDEAVLDHVNRTRIDDVPPLPWFTGSTREQPNQKTSNGGWRSRMEPAWIRMIERLNRRGMERYGYAIAELTQEPSVWDFVRALLRDVPGMAQFAYRFLTFKRRLYGHFEGRQRLDPQQGMEASININPAAWRYYPEFHMPQVPRLTARSQQ